MYTYINGTNFDIDNHSCRLIKKMDLNNTGKIVVNIIPLPSCSMFSHNYTYKNTLKKIYDILFFHGAIGMNEYNKQLVGVSNILEFEIFKLSYLADKRNLFLTLCKNLSLITPEFCESLLIE